VCCRIELELENCFIIYPVGNKLRKGHTGYNVCDIAYFGVCDNSIEYELYSVYEGLMELHIIFVLCEVVTETGRKKEEDCEY
jgi:uncharacterized membrane protein